MFVEAKILSEIQTAREIVKNKHNTLHYDETSKKGFKYGSIQVTTEQDQSYVLGLFDMDGGAAERYASFTRMCFAIWRLHSRMDLKPKEILVNWCSVLSTQRPTGVGPMPASTSFW